MLDAGYMMLGSAPLNIQNPEPENEI